MATPGAAPIIRFPTLQKFSFRARLHIVRGAHEAWPMIVGGRAYSLPFKPLLTFLHGKPSSNELPTYTQASHWQEGGPLRQELVPGSIKPIANFSNHCEEETLSSPTCRPKNIFSLRPSQFSYGFRGKDHVSRTYMLHPQGLDKSIDPVSLQLRSRIHFGHPASSCCLLASPFRDLGLLCLSSIWTDLEPLSHCATRVWPYSP